MSYPVRDVLADMWGEDEPEDDDAASVPARD